MPVNVISKATLADFYTAHPEAESALLSWYTLVSHARWRCFADVRMTFNSVDQVGDVLVFNSGARRIVGRISYSPTRSRLYIQHVFTHREYDEWSRKK
jgi:mRNA interferase HigB